MIKILVSSVELGAFNDVLYKLPHVREKKIYDSHVRKLTAYLLSLHKIRGNDLPDGTGWKFQYISQIYTIDTRDMQYTFDLFSEQDRKEWK